MKKQSTIIQIKDGKVVEKQRIVNLFKVKDGRYEIEISSISKRSNQANRFIHGVLFPEFKNALCSVGYNIQSDEQAKEVSKKMFLSDRIVNEKTGEVLEYTKHTADLTKEEMNVFIEDVIRFSAEEMNYVIPYPNEQVTISYE